jgi:hypothetical protein
LDKLREAFGEFEAMDRRTFLSNNLGTIHRDQMREVVNTAKQVASVEINKVGDRKKLDDGTEWELTALGWAQLLP